MGCNCKWTEIVLGAVILIAMFVSGVPYADWIIAIAAIVLILHALMCKNCGTCMPDKGMEMKKTPRKSKPKSKKKK